jgi:hypothetical protein
MPPPPPSLSLCVCVFCLVRVSVRGYYYLSSGAPWCLHRTIDSGARVTAGWLAVSELVGHERWFEGLKDQLQEVTDDLRSLNAQRDQQTSELTQTLEVVDKLRQQMAEAVSAAEDAVRASSGDGAAAAAAAAAGGSADMDPEDWMAKSETTLRNVVLRRRARNALGTATH